MKRLSLLTLLAFLLTILLAACQPAPQPTAVAVVEGPTAAPTDPPDPTTTQPPTSTPAPTNTPGPTNTPAPTDIPTATPDGRVIAAAAETFASRQTDLPHEGRFYLPPSTGRVHLENADLLAAWGEERGQEFIQKTGRIDGWQVTYIRGSDGVRSPERVKITVSQFATSQGAQTAVLEYNPAAAPWIEEGWQVFTDTQTLGAAVPVTATGTLTETAPQARLALVRHEPHLSGKNLEHYRLEIAYRNYAISIETRSFQGDIPFAWLENVAKTVLARLEVAELSAALP